MTPLLKPQRGASLLTVILLIAIVGAMVLAGSRALQEASRSAAVIATREEARQVVQTGLMEGLYYLNKADLSATDGEYGTITDRTATTFYSNTVIRRGFVKSDATCSQQSAAETLTVAMSGASNINLACPYYDIAIRDRAAYGPSPYGSSASFTLWTKDFPEGYVNTIPLRTALAQFFIPYTSSGTGQPLIANEVISFCTSRTVCPPANTATYHMNDTVTVPVPTFNFRYMQVTVHYGASPGNADPSPILTFLSPPASQTVVGNGYPTLEITGHSGDTVLRQLYMVRAGIPYLAETTGVFDQYGTLKR